MSDNPKTRDIVDRLRNPALWDGQCGDDAADEIERLREAMLETITKYDDPYAMREVLLRALANSMEATMRDDQRISKRGLELSQ